MPFLFALIDRGGARGGGIDRAAAARDGLARREMGAGDDAGIARAVECAPRSSEEDQGDES